MSDDTTNNVDTTVAPAVEEPIVSVPNGTPESAPVPEVPMPESEIEKSL